MPKKYALAPCNGMSPNGLVSRVATGDCKKENENVISICMGSTSADIEGTNDEMLKKFPIISLCGCQGNCVTKILENRGIDIYKTINVEEILKDKKSIIILNKIYCYFETKDCLVIGIEIISC